MPPLGCLAKILGAVPRYPRAAPRRRGEVRFRVSGNFDPFLGTGANLGLSGQPQNETSQPGSCITSKGGWSGGSVFFYLSFFFECSGRTEPSFRDLMLTWPLFLLQIIEVIVIRQLCIGRRVELFLHLRFPLGRNVDVRGSLSGLLSEDKVGLSAEFSRDP